MSDIESLRDRLIAYTLTPWMTPARSRLLRETFESWTDVGRASATFLQTLLQLSETWKVDVVRDPLRSPEMRRQVARVRRQAVTLLEDAYPPLLKEIIDPPLALFYDGDLALAVPGLRRYLQCHTRDGAYGIGEAVLDAAYQLWFDDVDALTAAVESPEFKQVEEDWQTFVQPRYIHRMVTRENWVIGPQSR